MGIQECKGSGDRLVWSFSKPKVCNSLRGLNGDYLKI